MRESNSHDVHVAWRVGSPEPCGQQRNVFAGKKISAVPTLPALSPNAQGCGKRSFDARHTTRRHRELKSWASLPNLCLDDCREQDADTSLGRGLTHWSRQELTVHAVAAVNMPPRSSSNGQQARRIPLRKLNSLCHGPSNTLVVQSRKRIRRKVRVARCMAVLPAKRPRTGTHPHPRPYPPTHTYPHPPPQGLGAKDVSDPELKGLPPFLFMIYVEPPFYVLLGFRRRCLRAANGRTVAMGRVLVYRHHRHHRHHRCPPCGSRAAHRHAPLAHYISPFSSPIFLFLGVVLFPRQLAGTSL